MVIIPTKERIDMITHPEKHTILVSGATGQQGSAVVRHLLDNGFNVRALTRNTDQIAACDLAETGVELFQGDFMDRSSLDRALDGVYGAFSVQNAHAAGIEGEIKQGKAFADAVKDAGVKHFVYSSVGGAERNTGIPHFDSKWEIEKHIRQLEIPNTILRPVFFMNNWTRFKDSILDGQVLSPMKPDTKLQQIAVDDIGIFAAVAFANPDKWLSRAIEIAGDDLTMSATTKTFGLALDMNVEYVQVPWDKFEEQAGSEMTTMYRWFEEKGYEANITTLRDLHPGLKDLSSFLQTQDWVSREHLVN